VRPLSIDEAKEFRAYLERVRDAARAELRAGSYDALMKNAARIEQSANVLHRWTNDFLTSVQEG
jgi:hypothetical protein